MTEPTEPQQPARTRLGEWLAPYVPDYFPVAWKLGLSISLLILCGMTVLGTLLLNNQLSRMRDQADTFGMAIAQQLANTAREPMLADDSFLLKVQLNNLTRSESVRGAALFDREGNQLDKAGILPLAATPLNEQIKRWELQSEPVTTYYSTIQVDETIAGYAAISLSDRPIMAARQAVQDTMITATLIMSIIAIIVSFVISRRLAQPIQDLLAATSAMRKGDLNYRIQDRRNDEIGGLIEAYNTMAHGMLEKDQVEKVLQRFVSPSVARNMMADLDQVQLGGRDVQATVVFADIVGFTRLSETLEPEAIGDMLNVYFDAITTATSFYRGTIDKYMGDCAMIVFGVPEKDDEHLFHGLCCAVMIQRLVERLNEYRRAQGQTTVEFRIGINSGAMLAGNLGSRDRMQYTVVGDAVNLASRLSNMAAGNEIIAAAPLLGNPNIGSRVRATEYGAMRIRGKSEPVSTFRIDGVHALSETLMEQRIAQFLAKLNTEQQRAQGE
ncbi:hypothetical protein Y5S_03083 [Alcanivorax nanhaiticus]|uniref:Adenylate cyclase n=1 Tax=Alcanivorax nanhaiticus TaxID=1177154 RepID=A0A095UMC9_9GAMM|nr:adenylate/guanylate cyclase domain-containing protein [Alcanivorax nanhaiticus]KGD63660.1 hypothetical protein Y5S_03083 [Alcanivorax nanhaiticus]